MKTCGNLCFSPPLIALSLPQGQLSVLMGTVQGLSGHYGSHELQGCNVVYHAVSSPFHTLHPHSPCGPFPSDPPFLDDHLSFTCAEPASPGAHCLEVGCSRETQQKCRSIELRLILEVLQYGDLMGEERMESP